MVRVAVSDTDFRQFAGPHSYWLGTGGWFLTVYAALGEDVGLSVIMSRVAADLRRKLGPEDAKKLLLEMVDLMDAPTKVKVAC